MAHVIGIPLLKGNSQVIVSGDLKNFPQAGYFSGMAVGYTGIAGGVQVNIVTLDNANSKGFFGFITEINQCSGKATVCRAAESLPLPSDGTITAAGQVFVDPATGLITDAATLGAIPVSGAIIDDGTGTLTAKNGQTGEDVANPVLINLAVSPIFAAAAVAAAKKSALTDKA